MFSNLSFVLKPVLHVENGSNETPPCLVVQKLKTGIFLNEM
jgi:hypothetical protein